jgi:tetratricopeptide (TPR) repeat protein
MHDVSHLPKLEQERSLGLAYHRLLETAKNREQVRVYRGRAIGLLEGVRKQGRDPDVESALARIYATARMPGAKELAESALELEGISPWSLSNALIVAAQHQVEANENERALKTLDRLLRVRQYPSDLMLLGRCYYNIGNRDAAIEALTKAVKLDGTSPEYHHYLGLLYSETGKQKLAAKHKARAQQLANLQKKSRRKNAP